MASIEKISKAMLALTYDCNLRCDYCFCGKKSNKKLTPEDAKKALEFILDNAAPKIFLNFFGGEPLLEDDLISDLIAVGREIAKKKNIDLKFQITTNGTIYPKNNIENLKKKDVTLLVSVDGIQPAHDLHRKKKDGSGSYSQVVNNLEKLFRDSFIVDIRTTLTPKNLEYFSESTKYFIGKGVRCVYSDIVVEEKWDRLSMKELEKQHQEVADFYIDCLRKNKDVLIGFIDNHLKHRFNKSKLMQCEAGVNNISIFPDGNIYACYTFAGSWNKEKVGIIGDLDSGISEEKTAPYVDCKYNWKFMDTCKECMYSGVCFASCFGNNLRATGNITTMAASACTFEKITANIAFKTADLLLTEGNRILCNRISQSLFRPYLCQTVF